MFKIEISDPDTSAVITVQNKGSLNLKKIKKIMENSIIGRGGVSDVKFHNSKKYS